MTTETQPLSSRGLPWNGIQVAVQARHGWDKPAEWSWFPSFKSLGRERIPDCSIQARCVFFFNDDVNSITALPIWEEWPYTRFRQNPETRVSPITSADLVQVNAFLDSGVRIATWPNRFSGAAISKSMQKRSLEFTYIPTLLAMLLGIIICWRRLIKRIVFGTGKAVTSASVAASHAIDDKLDELNK